MGRTKKLWNSDGAKTLELIVIYREVLLNTFKTKKGTFGLAPKCHADKPSIVTFKNGKLNLDCAACKGHMLELAVDVDVDFDIAPCDDHPDQYGEIRVWFDGKVLKLACGVCGKTIQKVTPN